jgi:hypothetical protein
VNFSVFLSEIDKNSMLVSSLRIETLAVDATPEAFAL